MSRRGAGVGGRSGGTYWTVVVIYQNGIGRCSIYKKRNSNVHHRNRNSYHFGCKERIEQLTPIEIQETFVEL